MPDESRPAFPTSRYGDGEGGPIQGGLTMRDYFAAAALQGICASGPSSTYTNQALANEAYSVADAMLEAREA